MNAVKFLVDASTMELMFATVLLSSIAVTCSTTTGNQDFCESEVFEPRCHENHVVVMDTAIYGIMEIGKCIKRDFGYIGCYADVLPILDARCSGKATCSVKPLKEDFQVPSPCPEELKQYLRVTYSCIPVIPVNPLSCRQNQMTEVSSMSGTIGSVVTSDTGCGGPKSPWVIKARPGQTIRFTLYDFTADGTKLEAGHTQGSTGCTLYAIMKETSSGKSTNICGGTKRINQALVSTSNIVEIRIVTDSISEKSFLLKYEASGCPLPEPPPNGWIKRDGQTAMVGCNGSGKSWEITCDGTIWTDNAGESCSEVNTGIIIGSISIPYTLSVMIVVGAGLLVALCVCCTGYLIVKRQSLRAQRQQMKAVTGKQIDPSDPYMSTNYMHFSRATTVPAPDSQGNNCLEDFLTQSGVPINTMDRKEYHTNARNNMQDPNIQEYYQDSMPRSTGRETPPPYSQLIMGDDLTSRPLPPPPADMLG